MRVVISSQGLCFTAFRFRARTAGMWDNTLPEHIDKTQSKVSMSTVRLIRLLWMVTVFSLLCASMNPDVARLLDTASLQCIVESAQGISRTLGQKKHSMAEMSSAKMTNIRRCVVELRRRFPQYSPVCEGHWFGEVGGHVGELHDNEKSCVDHPECTVTGVQFYRGIMECCIDRHFACRCSRLCKGIYWPCLCARGVFMV